MTASPENYPAFSGFKRACPKCTVEGGAKYTYQPETAQQPQHMRRECLCCGYTWQEKCADA